MQRVFHRLNTLPFMLILWTWLLKLCAGAPIAAIQPRSLAVCLLTPAPWAALRLRTRAHEAVVRLRCLLYRPSPHAPPLWCAAWV